MRIPLEISFKNLDSSPAIEAQIREKADKFDRFYPHVMRCRVTVEAPHPPSSPMPDACAVRPRSMKSRCTAGSRACFPWEGYGFIETTDGQEVYFHKNSVVEDGFDRLEVGGEVRLSVAEGESSQGPQATTVLPAGKHHLTE